MLRRSLAVCITVGTIAALQSPARANTVNDQDDRLPRLDIRSASVVQVAEDELQVRLVFWDRTPQWLLRRHAARIRDELCEAEARVPSPGFRFWPNRRGQLRITWGEPASDCCARHGAQHPESLHISSVDSLLYRWRSRARASELPRGEDRTTQAVLARDLRSQRREDCRQDCLGSDVTPCTSNGTDGSGLCTYQWGADVGELFRGASTTRGFDRSQAVGASFGTLRYRAAIGPTAMLSIVLMIALAIPANAYIDSWG